MPVTMYDRDGNAVSVPEDQAVSLYKAGTLGVPEGTMLPVITADGVVDKPIEELATQTVPESIETPEERATREKFEKYGGFGAQAQTFGEAALGAGSLGLYDVIASGVGGDEYRAARAAREEVNPFAKTAGEVTGMIAPAIVSGGESLLARGVTALGAPAAGVGLAGRAIGTAVRGGLESVGLRGTSVLGRAALRGVEYGAAGAAEGAFYGAGQALTEAALAPGGDYDHLASKLASGALRGSETGALLGGSIGAISGAGGAVLEKLKTSGALGKIEERAVLGAIDPSKRAARELIRTGRARETARQLVDNDIVGIGRSTEDMLERATSVSDESGGRIGDLLKRVDDSGAKVNTKKLFDDVENLKAKYAKSLDPEVAKIADRIEERVSLVRQASKTPEELAELGITGTRPKELTFQELHRFRTSIDDRINWATETKGQELKDAWKDLRRIVEHNIEGQAEKALPKQFLAEYQAAKKTYGAATWAKSQLTDNLARGQVNNTFSLSDKIIGAGAMAGSLAHGNLAGIAAGAAHMVGHKLIREYAPGAIGVLAARVRNSDEHIAKAVQKFFAKPAEAGKVVTLRETVKAGQPTRLDKVAGVKNGETRDEAYRRKLAEVQRATDPTNLERKIGTLASHAPNTASAIVNRTVRAAQYLQSQAPTASIDPEALQPNLQMPTPDPTALASWFRKVQIVENPSSIFEELENGTLTRDHVNTLKAVDPGLYSDIQSQIYDQLVNAKTIVPYDKRMQLGILLDLPTDKSLRPASIAAAQAIYQKPEPPPEPAPEPKQGGRAKSFRTDIQALEAGEFDF